MGFPARRTSLLVTPSAPVDVTLTLSGVVAVCFLGAAALTATIPAVGQTATASITSFLSTTKNLTGVLATASKGALVTVPTFTLFGKQGTSALGTIVVVGGGNAQTVVDSFRVQLLNGQHAFGPSVIRASTAVDTFKVALYYTTATRNASDTIYSSAGEVVGTNYVAGGVVLANTVVPTNTAGIAYWTPSAVGVFTNVTITTAFDCFVLYNNTSAAKLAVAVYTFGPQVITAGDFTLQFATNNSVTGLIRLT